MYRAICNMYKQYKSPIGKNNVTSQNSWVFRRGNFRFDVAHVCIVSLCMTFAPSLGSVLKIQL